MASNKATVDFFDLPSAGESSSIPISSKQQSFFDIPTPDNDWVKPPAPSTKEQLRNAPYLFAQEAGAGLYSLPSSTAETYRFLADKLQKLGEDQAAEQGREISQSEKDLTNKFVNAFPDLVKETGEKFPNIFPTHEQAKKKLAENVKENEGIDLPEKGRGAIERSAQGAGKAVPVIAFPGSAAVKAAAVGTSALTEGLDLSEKNKVIGNLSVPALTALIQSIVTRRYRPGPGEAEHLLEEGRRLGMTDEQLAPILASERQVARHGGMAADVRRTQASFQETRQVLGNVIEDMQNRPANQIQLPARVQNNLINRFHNIENDIRTRTHALAPHEEALANFLNTAITDIQNNGSNPRQLIGLVRSINRIGAGRTELRRAMAPIQEALNAVDPQLGHDLETTNRLYGRFINNLEEINPTQFHNFMNAGELQHLIGAVFSGDPKKLGRGLIRQIGVNSFKRISSRILTDPRAQSLVRNFGQAVRDGRQASARALSIQFKNYVQKNLPEDYEEIEWEKIGFKP